MLIFNLVMPGRKKIEQHHYCDQFIFKQTRKASSLNDIGTTKDK